MKNLTILIIFSFSLSLYSGDELFPFGMNFSIYEEEHSLIENKSYKTKYKTSMDLCAQAGIKWWRAMFAFRWCDVKPDSLGDWDFETEDSLVKWAEEKGLNLLPSIGYTAYWAGHPAAELLDKERTCYYPPNPQRWDKYKNYIDTLVKRYKNDIKYWEFMNEPYGKRFLGTPEQYVAMFESTRVALKNAVSTSKIVGPCMATRNDSFKWRYFDTTSNSIKESTFGYTCWQNATSCIIRSIGLDSIDVISHHIYIKPTVFMEYVVELRDSVGEDKPIWITETGYKNSSAFTEERGTDNVCGLTSLATYFSEAGEDFWCNVCLQRDNGREYYEKIDTFLNVGDIVVLHNSSKNANDTIIYNGGPLIYGNKDTALAIGDTLIIFKGWAEETEIHCPATQASRYDELLESIINTPNFLNNLKIFFYSADNTIHEGGYYPPIIRFWEKSDASYKPTRYYRQRQHEYYSVIDINDNPYPAYYTIKSYILHLDTN